MRVVLVGFMGSGKTSFGKKLAKKLNIPFIDSDQEIEKQENKSINEIFNTEGELAFRAMESDFIQKLNANSNSFLLSTGGGLPCYHDNMKTLNSIGPTVYLQLPSKALAKRLENGKENRPLIKNLSLEELEIYIDTKLEEREPFYLQSKIIQEGLSINAQVMQELIDQLIQISKS